MSEVKKITVEVPGKVILTGEHAVVYGQKAVVMAVNRVLTITSVLEENEERIFYRHLLTTFHHLGVGDVLARLIKIKGEDRLKIESNIPIGSGLGSSAALAVALSTLIMLSAKRKMSLEKINNYAYQLERQAHLNPSGIDNSVVVWGGINEFQNTKKGICFLPIEKPLGIDKIVIVNSGMPSETTGEMVELVKQTRERWPGKFKLAMREIEEAEEMISRGDFGKGFLKNERALENLGVVSQRTSQFIRKIEQLGGVAKISGAGGYRTNSGMVLVYAPGNRRVEEYLALIGWEQFPLKIHSGLKFRIM